MSPVGLAELLAHLPRQEAAELLVGFDTHDDAAVYRLGDDQAVVLSADLITPPVDDPAQFGRIAAANALSDVYAMGGRPLVCLNLVGFPSGKLGPEVLHGMVAGALEKIEEAGALLAGGHSWDDEEPKYGLVVLGLVHPDRLWTNRGASPGDAVLLTKPIGSGVLLNAAVQGKLTRERLGPSLAVMATLNRSAAEVLGEHEVHAVTDVTGFGLAGHALEMARGSGVSLALEAASIPVFEGAAEAYRQGVTTGINPKNRELVESHLVVGRAVPSWQEELLFDPQTSGGLLAAVPSGQAEAVLGDLRAARVADARRIGRVEEGDGRTFLRVL